ncbi:MAG: XisI protein [Aulosira sp. DedQUE10]|nr:XisI protein [Aulosira sp. DedQUE10]
MSAKYRQIIEELLKSHAEFETSNLDIESQLIVDTGHDYYQILEVGWEGMKRVYNCVMHLDIKNGKIWIQRNMTDVDIAQKLLEMGVTKEDIILGLHPPYKRPYTGYGVA